jgi:CheY-like chemotaxis protein
MASAPATVVIVEDSDDVREYLSLLCETDGWRTVTCDSEEQAFQAVQQERPELLITDVMLGMSSGLDLITHLRSDLPPPLPPIIVISGFDHYQAEAIARGADAFIPKPFDSDTLRATISTVLGHECVTENARDQAIRRSQQLRAEAHEAARVALLRLRRNIVDFERRASWSAVFLARYLGVGEAVVALLDDQGLRVMQATNPEHWPPNELFELPLCMDILETNSTLAVPDLAALSARARRRDGVPVRFFTGAPLRAGKVAVGVTCLLSDRVVPIEAEDLGLLHYFARRGSALLTADRPEIGPVFSSEGLITRPLLNFLVASELRRAQHEDLALRLLACAGEAPRLDLGSRTALAELGSDRYALLVSRPNERITRRETLALVHHAIDQRPPRAGILLSIEGDALGAFSADDILRYADVALEQRLRRGDQTVDQLLIRRQPLEHEPAPWAG